ncbi:BgtTE-56041 [Blumeria graminis f. sp. tritici]|uniref:BgtTE-56041 n=1 Tax=Blumeria graminis f. sp. tritici TaxID=62690 RepID=A0A9X9QCT3_BLUGR|nr:BgtTE-56041 [Blumeria graminis f. sp. tritici]
MIVSSAFLTTALARATFVNFPCSRWRIHASCSLVTGPDFLGLTWQSRLSDRWGPPQLRHFIRALHSASECILEP